MIILTEAQYQEILEHARTGVPEEVCGILAGEGETVKHLYKMKNTEQSATRYFMEPREQLRVFKEMRERGWEMLGIYHSHPATPARPSEEDIKLAFYPEASYLILSLEDPKTPVLRAFRIHDGKVSEDDLKIK